MKRNHVLRNVGFALFLKYLKTFMDRSETRDYEKEIIGYIEEGEYYSAIERYEYYSDMTITGFSKKIDEVVWDAVCYVLICENLEILDTDFEY